MASSRDSTLSETQLQELIWISIGLVFLVLGARLTLRLQHQRRLLLDDYLLLVAFAFTTSMGAMHTLSLGPLFTIRGGGMPSPGEMEQFLRVQFAAKTLFWMNVYSVKFSLLAFLRTFLHALPSSRKYWWLTLGVVLLGAAGALVGSITECSPLHRNFSLADGCASASDLQNSRIVLTSLTCWDILTDGAIIALPLPLLASMRRSLTGRQLASLALLFSIGGLITIFAALRLGRIWANEPVEDFPWQVTVAVTWAQVEAAVAITVGCAPAFKVLLVRRQRSGGHLHHARRPRGRVVGNLRTWVGHQEEGDDSLADTTVSGSMAQSTDVEKSMVSNVTTTATMTTTTAKEGPEARVVEVHGSNS